MRLSHCLTGLVAILAGACAACAGSPAPPASSPQPDEARIEKGKSTPIADGDDPAPGPVTPPLWPTACADPSAPFCTPPRAFVERLCKKPHQDVALSLFARALPFTRLYVRGRIDELLADEEVMVLRFHAPQKGGIVVGTNAGTVDVLRWDGSCSMAVESEIITRTRPARLGAAHIQWHRISSRVQDALVGSSAAVKKAHARRGKECKGAISGDVSAACEKADAALANAVVDYVRSGGSIPEPDDLP